MTEAFDVVCIGAHPDDVEIGMGATVAKMVARGARVAIVDLTDGEPTPHGSPSVRAAESAEAARLLGAHRVTLTLPNRFLFDSVEARFELAEVLRELRPAMMFIPYPSDAHPDHIAASSIAVAARFYGKLSKTALTSEPHFVPRLYHFAAVHQRMVAPPSYIVDVDGYLDTKLAALRAYRSQFGMPGHNERVLAAVETQAYAWGTAAGCTAGEAFFAFEPLVVDTPDVLLR